MSSINKERILFTVFCLISLSSHYSTLAYEYITNKYLIIIFAYFNLFLNITFKPIEVFFHEASHGLAAIATGNKIISLGLSLDGSGQVIYAKSGILSMSITTFAGYAGAAIWGYLIYASSLRSKKISRFLLILFCLSFVYFSKDIKTIIILSIIILVFFISWILDRFGAYLLRFIGIFIMISAIFSPTYLLNHANKGDHIIMQSLTSLPATLWITIWFLLSLLCLYEAYRLLITFESTDNI